MRRNYDDRSTTSKHDVNMCTSFLYIAKIGPRFSKTLLYKHISAHHRVLMAKLECTENKHILLSRCAKHTCPLFWGGMILKNCSLLGCLRHKPYKVNICTCWRTLFSEHSRSKKDNTQDVYCSTQRSFIVHTTQIYVYKEKIYSRWVELRLERGKPHWWFPKTSLTLMSVAHL